MFSWYYKCNFFWGLAMGKGSSRRPRSITPAEEDLRWELVKGEISLAIFNRRYGKLRRDGLLRRNGRVLK